MRKGLMSKLNYVKSLLKEYKQQADKKLMKAIPNHQK